MAQPSSRGLLALLDHVKAVLGLVATLLIIAVGLLMVDAMTGIHVITVEPTVRTTRTNAPENPPPPPPPALPGEPITLEGAALRGTRNAPLAMVECRTSSAPSAGDLPPRPCPNWTASTSPRAKVLFAYPPSCCRSCIRWLKAAEAAECAGRQGKFWAMHDRLFAEQSQLPSRAWLPAGGGAPRTRRFSIALYLVKRRPRFRPRATGRAVGMSGTPGFFLGRLRSDGRVDVTDAWLALSADGGVQRVIEGCWRASEPRWCGLPRPGRPGPRRVAGTGPAATPAGSEIVPGGGMEKTMTNVRYAALLVVAFLSHEPATTRHRRRKNGPWPSLAFAGAPAAAAAAGRTA
ncbi:MAG: hypothetical protein R2752_07690 [Vicinamibacterales bacterium]